MKVSVCILAYNHKKYIAQCLESIIAQKTDFPFEILVHDDHSDDGTTEIILDYAKKNPDLIVPVLEEKNRFKELGISGIYREILYPKAKGEYVTYCEGDDFWKDPEKLQKQVSILDANPECHMCLHFARVTAEDGTPADWGYPQNKIETGVLSGFDFMKGLTDGYFFHTTSFMCRMKDIQNMIHDLPEYYRISDVDDVPLLLYFGQLGSVYYLNEELTCYRRDSIGSWTQGQTGNTDKIISHKWRMIEMYRSYDIFTKKKYHSLVEHWINNERFMIAEWEHDFKEMVKPQYREFTTNRSLSFKIKTKIRSFLPVKKQ